MWPDLAVKAMAALLWQAHAKIAKALQLSKAEKLWEYAPFCLELFIFASMKGPVEETLMRRCFALARLANGATSPNPMVGALIEYEGRILGEGYHRVYGQAHAEVEAFGSVSPKDLIHIPKSTLFVSLEPCCIHRNTPACTNLIIREKFRRVVVSVRDPNPEVNGRGLEILRKAGIEVVEGVLAEEGRLLIAPQLRYYESKRPYVLLKYAQTANGYLGLQDRQLSISHPLSQRLVHRWRSESDALLIGSGTALCDNPRLNNRLWFGGSPLRIVLDRRNRLKRSLHLFDDSLPTLIFSKGSAPLSGFRQTKFLPYPQTGLPGLLEQLAERGVRKLLVEGGRQILQSFIAANLWDEIWRGSSTRSLTEAEAEQAVPAPQLPPSAQKVNEFQLGWDRWEVFRNFTLNLF